MRGLTIKQPWASLLALGTKTIETRSWWTAYRGPVLIHASRAFPDDDQALCHRDPFVDALLEGGYRRSVDLPRGAILAVAMLEAVMPTGDLQPVWDAALTRPGGFEWLAREQAFGDFTPNRYAWFLAGVRRLASPVTVRGNQGLWWPEPVVLDRLRQAGAL